MTLYTIPPGADFASAFGRGLAEAMAGQPPEAMAAVQVLVNTRRSLRAIEDALAATLSPPALLPRLSLLSELGADPLAEPDLPPAIHPLRRRLRLTRLVERYLDATEGAAARAAAPDLADALAALLDALDEEGIAPDRLDALAPAEMARHWHQTLRFADIVRDAWPAIRADAEGGALDPKARQRAVIERLVARWQAQPPRHPVIAAASTGSVASTAELLAAVARLPRGAVVLPGFDPEIPAEIWSCVAGDDGIAPASPDHPMAPFAQLFRLLDARPADVRPWGAATPPGPRYRLLAQALRPAPVTDAWAEAAPALAAEVEAATAGLTLVEAENQRIEAGVIALAIRRELEVPDRRIALITPDATLARRVSGELARFGVEPDDSLGRPLALSPAGVFLRLVAEAAEPGATPVAVAALLQHPMTRAGYARRTHRSFARAYEAAVLRQRPQPDRPAGALPVWDRADAEQATWLAAVEAPLRGLATAMAEGSLCDIVAMHVAAAEALSREAATEPLLWTGEDGARLRRFLAELARHADAHSLEPVESWPGLMATLLVGEQVRPAPARPHPRVAIRGTMEARVQAADLVILGGLNEGVWPPLPGADPWLSRPMRQALGLAPPERAIGLSAHDFLQAAARSEPGSEVILTRSLRIDGTPTVASRWLLRLSNLLGGLAEGQALAAMRARGEALTRLVALVHRPEAPVPPAQRPAPRPPAEARPQRLSATQIERLIRDAYAIYAQKILRLEPMDPLGRPANYMDRGTVIHAILQRFVEETRDGLPPDAEARARLLAIAEEVLGREVPWPDIRRVWLGRVDRFADWFVEGEQERRQAGRPSLIERRGEMQLLVAGEPFRVSARADRIDRLEDGAAAIFDYKAGQPPGAKQIGLFSHQLHIQAAILMAGGFEGMEPAETRVGAYLGLHGRPPGGKESRARDLPDGLSRHTAWLTALLEAYAAPATPYLSRGRIERIDSEGDYDHLARRWEWEEIAG